MNEFNLEHQYQLFLTRIGLIEDKMPPEQKQQLKLTFMGAIGQILVLLRDDLTKLPAEEQFKTWEDMMNQVGDYFFTLGNKLN